jgi:hypothetical protein
MNLLKLASDNAHAGRALSPHAVARAFLLTEESFASPLLLICADQFGTEFFDWSPETIQLELEQIFKLKLPRFSLDKIMAAVTLVTTNVFFTNVSRFITLCNILSGDEFQPDEFDPADASEILLGISEAMLIWPPESGNSAEEFSPEIRGYIAEVLKKEGIIRPFDVLKLALNGDQSAKVDADWADDPELYTGIYQSQAQRQGDMTAVFLENMAQLRQQLSLLVLENGDASQAIERLDAILEEAKQ